jgi:hypothetical protein
MLVVQCVVSAVVLAVGVMLLAVGSLVVGGVVAVAASAWLWRCVRRM